MKTVVTLLLLNAVMAFAADEWNEETGFQDWDRPARCTVSYDDGHLRMNVTGDDCSVLNSKVDLDPKEYEFIVFEYRATGAIKPLPGQIYFAGEDGAISGKKFWRLTTLKADGEWHRAWISEVPHGKDLWTKENRITKLRFDPFSLGTGEVEVRLIKLIRRMPFIEPADEDIGYGSSRHLHLWGTGRSRKSPFIVGKGNKFDHRYRFLARIPFDKLLAKSHVEKAELEFRLKFFTGSEPRRVYLVEALDEDILKLKANDLNTDKVSLLAKVELSAENASVPVRIDMTEAVNRALSKVRSGVTVRIRPEDEQNEDPGASGAAIDPHHVRMYYR